MFLKVIPCHFQWFSVRGLRPPVSEVEVSLLLFETAFPWFTWRHSFPPDFPSVSASPFQSTMGSGLKRQCSLAKSPYMLGLSSLCTFHCGFMYFLDFTAWHTHEPQIDTSSPNSSPVLHNICLVAYWIFLWSFFLWGTSDSSKSSCSKLNFSLPPTLRLQYNHLKKEHHCPLVLH